MEDPPLGAQRPNARRNVNWTSSNCLAALAPTRHPDPNWVMLSGGGRSRAGLRCVQAGPSPDPRSAQAQPIARTNSFASMAVSHVCFAYVCATIFIKKPLFGKSC